MATDTFSTQQPGLTSPARGAAAITPDNSNDLTTATRAVYVGGAGDMKVDMLDGQTVTFVGMLAGNIYPLRVKRVYATGTDATDLIGIY